VGVGEIRWLSHLSALASSERERPKPVSRLVIGGHLDRAKGAGVAERDRVANARVSVGEGFYDAGN